MRVFILMCVLSTLVALVGFSLVYAQSSTLEDATIEKLKAGSNESALDVTNVSSSALGSADSFNDNSTTNENTNVGEGKKDISGHYSNIDLGIVDFVIPQGWYGSESFDADKLLEVNLQQGTNQERLDKLMSLDALNSTELTPQIIVSSSDKKQNEQVMAILGPSNRVCTSVESNSTSTIGGKVFKVSTMECKLYAESATNQQANSSTSLETNLIKKYEYETPNTLYSVELILPTQEYGTSVFKTVDISRYTPTLDLVVNSLKLK